MTPLPQTPELLRVAERVVWFKPPSETLADPLHFLAHLMTWGTPEDLLALEGIAGTAEFTEVLDHAPAGIFDPPLMGLLEPPLRPRSPNPAARPPHPRLSPPS